MLEKNKFYIGAWYGIDDNIVDSRRVKEIRDNGIDFIFTDNYHNERSEEVLRLCKENGVQCILFDREYYQRNEDFTPETVEVSSDHIGNPACIGHAIYDEPPKSLFKKISRNRDVYLKISG